jgi:hypothetical protein
MVGRKLLNPNRRFHFLNHAIHFEIIVSDPECQFMADLQPLFYRSADNSMSEFDLMPDGHLFFSITKSGYQKNLRGVGAP